MTSYTIGGSVTGLDSGQSVKLVKMVTPATASLAGTNAAASFPVSTGTSIVFANASTIGWSFSLDSSKTLSYLGLYNTDLNADTTVGIWNSSGSLLVSSVFDTSLTGVELNDLPNSNFIWLPVSSLTLGAGQYTIGAFSSADHFGVYGVTPTTTSGLHIVNSSLLNFANTFGKPANDFSGVYANGFFGPNLRFAAGDETLTVNADGYFVFPTGVADGDSYHVTVDTQPAGKTCTVTNGNGTVAGANVTNISVTCTPNPYTVGVNVSGLNGAVTLLNNGGNALTLNADGLFNFTSKVLSGSSYLVTVQTQPVGQTCLVTNGSGAIISVNVSNVSVSCTTNTYTVGGNVSGLASGNTVTLLNNTGNALQVTAIGSFTFTTAVLSGNSYLVTVQTQPVGQNCVVSNAAGNISGSDVTTVSVVCTTNVTAAYTVAGNVFGLSGILKLQNNGGNEITLTANGGFIFTTPLASGLPYAVTVSAQPIGQTCSVSFGSGTNISANVWGVIVTCSASGATYTVGGSLGNGMASSTIPLTNTRDTGTPEVLNVVTNGTANAYPFTFVTTQGTGGTYNITAGAAGMSTCYVSNGMGVITSANVTGLVVTCATQAAGTYTVSGTVSGLAANLILSLGGSQTVTLPAGATGFTFPTPLPASTSTVTVQTQPTGQTCAVVNGDVTITTANVTNVEVTCVSNSLASTIGGTVTGLGAGRSVTLLNNGGDSLVLLTGGNFTFPTRVVVGSSYAVMVGAQPAGQICTVTNGAGTSPGNNTNVTNVSVACAADTHTYTVGGSITGLSSSVTLLNNGGDNLVVGANGSFTFATALNSGANYSVTIGSQPAGQTCFLLNNSGSGISSNVNSVSVACSNNTYQVGGTVTNLSGSGLVLQLGKQTLSVNSGDSGFAFNTSLASGELYSVFISNQPISQTCSLNNASGVMDNINVTNVSVACAATGAASYNVVLGRPTESSITLSILGNSNDWGGSAYVQYGTTSGGFYPNTSATATSPVTAYPTGSTQPVIEVNLSGLAANTKYYYRVNYKAASASVYTAGNEYSFTTQRAPGSTFSFGVQGDSHPERYNDKMFHYELYKLTMAEIAKRQPDLYFMLGDDFSSEKMIDNFEAASYPGVTAFPLSVYGPGGTLSSFAQYSVVTSPFVQVTTGEGDSKATGSGAYLEQRQKYLGLMAHSTSLFTVNGNHEQAFYVNLGGIFNNDAVFAASARNKFYPGPTPVSYASFTGMGSGFYSGDTESFATGSSVLRGYPGVDGDGLLRDYYAFEWGDALFITIDPYWHSLSPVDTSRYSDAESVWGKSMGDAQYQWLKYTLEHSTKKYKFLFSHHINGSGRGGANNTMVGEWGGDSTGAFAVNRPTWSKPIHQLLVDTRDPGGATIFFQAHDHTFARETVDGVVYQSVANPADNSYWSYNCSAYAPPTIPVFPSEYSGYGQYNGNQSVVMPGAGYIHVTVSPQLVKLQYIRTYRSIDLLMDANKALYDSLSGRTNGEVAFSYSLPAQPGDDQAANNQYTCKGDAPPTGFVYNHYSVSGSLSGLGSGKFVTLLLNGGTALTLSSNGSFTFPTTLNGGAYAVTLGSQPAGQSCSVSSSSGNITTYPNGANVTNVSVTCN